MNMKEETLGKLWEYYNYLRGRKQYKAEEKHLMRTFLICLHQMSLR
jgi:hypothetical protein